VTSPRLWLAAALGAVAGFAAGARRRPRASASPPPEPGGGGDDAEAASLRADLASVQALLRQYMEQREVAEEQLRASEERYRLLAENAGDIIVLVGMHGDALRATYVSPSVTSVLGYTPDEVRLMSRANSPVHPDDRPALRDYLMQTLAGREHSLAFRVRHRDGGWRWISFGGRAVRDPDGGRVTGLVGIARDITKWHEATERLRESEAKYRMLAESIDDVVSVHDVDGTALYFSPSVERLTGWTAAELLGADSFGRVHPEDHPAMLDAFSRTLRGESAALVRWRNRARDGTYVRVETRMSLMRDEHGQPLHVLAVTRDIELRLRTEAALHETEERYRSLIARAAYGIYHSTLDGRFLDVNPALVAMLGYESAEELLRVNLATDVYSDPAERDRLLSLALAEDIATWVTVHWRRRDGTTIIVRLSARVVREPATGEVKYLEGIAEDITDRGRQEEMLRRSERMASLGHTLAGVAHELNNPLAAISGFAQLMLRGREWPEDDRVALQTIAHEAVRAGKIVKDLLTFSRRQEAAQRHQRVNLNHVVRYIFDAQRYAMETRGIRSAVTLEPSLAPVLADAAQMEQVVLNLVVNARQALEAAADTPAAAGAASVASPARVTARTMQQGDDVVLEIADNGPGIAPGDLSRIWDPFWTTKGEGEGTGLGLSVVHGIVTAHGGTIAVDSSLGLGTRFTIRLPAAPAADEVDIVADGADASLEEHLAERPLDILLVDDEEAILSFLRRYLASRGHAVMTAHDGEQALRIAEHSSFDVVVCDLRMPGMSGAEVIRRLRQFPGLAQTRYVLSTGDRDGPASGDEIARLGVSTVVEKPYEIDVLRRAVEEG
jgi:two-component system, cell cycle sensor histidine kinase and response regulator CckA